MREGQLPALATDRLQIASRATLARAPGPGQRRLLVLLLLAIIACSREPAATACPGQFDPSDLSRAQLRQENIGRIPEQGATSRETVAQTVAQRRGWIRENYRGVLDVAVGDGWGVTFTRDQLGDVTFHREDDHMIVTTVNSKANCPDPERGTLLIIGPEGLRVPVWFVYRP